jgi:hypothetical protein
VRGSKTFSQRLKLNRFCISYGTVEQLAKEIVSAEKTGSQGLKPGAIQDSYGTTKVVPGYKSRFSRKLWSFAVSNPGGIPASCEVVALQGGSAFPKWEKRSDFGVVRESIRMDVRVAGEQASCCGVNLALSGLGVGCFSSSGWEALGLQKE